MNTKVVQIFPERGNMAQVFPAYLSDWATQKIRAGSLSSHFREFGSDA